METLSDNLAKRVEGLIESHHHEKLLTTTGTRTLVCELLERNEGLVVVAELMQQPRRAFDVREQQRHNTGREIAHHRTRSCAEARSLSSGQTGGGVIVHITI